MGLSRVRPAVTGAQQHHTHNTSINITLIQISSKEMKRDGVLQGPVGGGGAVLGTMGVG